MRIWEQIVSLFSSTPTTPLVVTAAPREAAERTATVVAPTIVAPSTNRAGALGGAMPTGGARNLIPFYQGREPNSVDVTLDQILGWSDSLLESTHDYIQWLFPLETASGFNSTAPILDAETIRTFRNDPALKAQLLRSFRRMLSFYGLEMDEATRNITRARTFPTRSRGPGGWLTSGNHNFLRITRILNSLEILGLGPYSRAFFTLLQDIYRNEGQGIIGSATFAFWQRTQNS